VLSRRLAPWLYCHPRVRRAWVIGQALWLGAMAMLLTAPAAAASGLGSALDFSGLRDSRGIPIGAYLFSTVDVIEAMRHQGTDMDITDPGTWIPSLADNITVALTYSQVAAALGACTGFLLFICSMGIWVIKFALGTTWLLWLAAIAAPIVANINAVLTHLHVVPTALMICLIIGGVIALTKGVGRGIGIMASGFVVILLAAWLLRDPVTELTSPEGVLGMGRWLGFTVAMGVANNGPIVTDGSTINDAQVNQLTGWMVDVLARHSLQLMNFGQVIDARPGCADAWDAALMHNRTPQGPATAIKDCGALDAYAHAQQLSGESVGLFFLLNLVVMAALFALCYIAAEVLRVGFKAFWNVLILVPAAAVAVAPGPQRQFAKKAALRAVVHGLEMMFATAGLGVLLILMRHVMQGNFAGGVQITSPLLKLLMLVLLSWAAALAFRKMLHAFGDGGLPGPLSMAKSVVKVGAAGAAPLAQMQQLRNGARRVGHEFGPSDSAHLPGQNGEQGSAGPTQPGRRGHPPVAPSASASPRRPGGGSGGATAPPTAGAPPATGAPGGVASTPATAAAGGARSAAGAAGRAAGSGAAAGGSSAAAAAGGSAASGAAAGAAARTAAGVVAPEVVVGAMVAQKAVGVAQRTAGRSSASTPAPGLSAASPRPGRPPATPPDGARRDASPQPPAEARPTDSRPSDTAAAPAPPRAPAPPHRSTPAPNS